MQENSLFRRLKDAYDTTTAFEFIYRRPPKKRDKKRNGQKPRGPSPAARKRYEDYLRSPQWRALKAAIIAKRGNQCERCRSLFKIELHHLTYKRLGHELDADLQLCCRECHKQIHRSY